MNNTLQSVLAWIGAFSLLCSGVGAVFVAVVTMRHSDRHKFQRAARIAAGPDTNPLRRIDLSEVDLDTELRTLIEEMD